MKKLIVIFLLTFSTMLHGQDRWTLNLNDTIPLLLVDTIPDCDWNTPYDGFWVYPIADFSEEVIVANLAQQYIDQAEEPSLYGFILWLLVKDKF